MTTYESKAIERLPEGKGYFYADAAYDSWRVLNTVVDRGYLPIVKLGRTEREVTEQELGTKSSIKISTGGEGFVKDSSEL